MTKTKTLTIQAFIVYPFDGFGISRIDDAEITSQPSEILSTQSLELSEVVKIESEGVPEIAEADPYPGVPVILGRGVQDG